MDFETSSWFSDSVQSCVYSGLYVMVTKKSQRIHKSLYEKCIYKKKCLNWMTLKSHSPIVILC